MNRQVLKNVPLMLTCLAGLSAGVLLSPHPAKAAPPGTEFTYQGSLKSAGVPVMSNANFSFSLWNVATGGMPVAGPVVVNNVSVVDGLFTVELDFGQEVFRETLWLEITVNGTTLQPRQKLTATPYALQTRGIYVNDDGYVGIGTDDPIRPLHINNYHAHLRMETNGGHVGSWLELNNSSDDQNYLGMILFSNKNNLAPGSIQYEGISRDMTFHANLAERMRITGSGRVEIPGQVGIKNDNLDNITDRLHVSSAPGESALRVQVAGATKLRVHSNGNVVIGGFTTPTESLHVVGNIRATGAVTASCGVLSCSDGRYKTNLKPLGGTLEMIEKLHPVAYDWKREEFPDRNFSDRRQLGLIAQELREVMPEVVHEGADGYLAVDYSRLTPVLVQAMRELRTEKDRQLSEKSAELDALKVRLERLEAAMNVKK